MEVTEEHMALYDDVEFMTAVAVQLLRERVSLLTTFALAVAQTHPAPAALLEEFQRLRKEDCEDELPMDELTPQMRFARVDCSIFERGLVARLSQRT
ncbi:hypothetical protein LVB77_14715 [Lysobacter sp. 5GHs7-4]|uniref:hypothetical protein n=1 Tax=Lysobacter sp. 5GHs7-4 TaxID=2904253 RepID=UPI001E346353|nr:hypothetical protein [Lysobacter sp. 5GHs7-4]UHQ21918.1 hypothetical protein LVB77_14715 [Lysobacter sp. 5GHs7-4]